MRCIIEELKHHVCAIELSSEGCAVAAFANSYDDLPDWVVRAPGRVNLIGEHTDYNDGFVMPIAIDRAVFIAGRNIGGDRVRIHSVDFGEERS